MYWNWKKQFLLKRYSWKKWKNILMFKNECFILMWWSKPKYRHCVRIKIYAGILQQGFINIQLYKLIYCWQYQIPWTFSLDDVDGYCEFDDACKFSNLVYDTFFTETPRVLLDLQILKRTVMRYLIFLEPISWLDSTCIVAYILLTKNMHLSAYIKLWLCRSKLSTVCLFLSRILISWKWFSREIWIIKIKIWSRNQWLGHSRFW